MYKLLLENQLAIMYALKGIGATRESDVKNLHHQIEKTKIEIKKVKFNEKNG